MNQEGVLPKSDVLPIAVRAYVTKATSAPHPPSTPPKRKRFPKPSDWTLIFDTETTTDAAQKLRFGTYQVRKSGKLRDRGIFYDENTLTEQELNLINDYAADQQVTRKSVQAFIEDIFYGVGFGYRATIVGFNLPFDISRLALDHAPARSTSRNKLMCGGFTFKLSENPDYPRVQIKHISSRQAFIQFAATRRQRTSRGNRKRKQYQPVRRGFFIDAKTLAAALTSQSYSLAKLAQVLSVEAQKQSTDEHGQTLTRIYIDYAMQDTQTTWECYERLCSMYELHGLTLTEAHKIHSEASLGKAYLKEMGIQPWRQLQPDFPDALLGQIMSAYYGGRSEVHIRKTPTQVLYCDFLSMYPTVCTLMGLWLFVTAEGMTWTDSTEVTRDFLQKTDITDLQRQATWQELCTLVQVLPEGDIFPIRARYGGDAQYTIGLNYLSSEKPLWYTLADCLASKLLTGRIPTIVHAITFRPKDIQKDLKAVCVAGNPEYAVDPSDGDFFKRVIDLRSEVKNELKSAHPLEKPQLENQQLALKILANATSYGIFVELNVEQEKTAQQLTCYGNSGHPTAISTQKFEAPGRFFHPLLAALITGAARLMLATTERLTQDAGLNWAFCDTDSMALAKPGAMIQQDFYREARRVQEWFTPLNPYAAKSPLFKIEEYNYSLTGDNQLEPLYCYAISSKRYALYNIGRHGKVILRKVSAHGLGHLVAPYHRDDMKTLEGTQPWQQELWLEIIQSAHRLQQPDFSRLPRFDRPTLSRYSATTPALQRWFNGYNDGNRYQDQVKPFNFLLSLQANRQHKALKPVAPFNTCPEKAFAACFDRDTGEAIQIDQLKTYHEALAQYHLHPETKFLNGDYTDQGITQRRHIIVQSIQHIGKEANKWEEQHFTGFNPDNQIEYGICSQQRAEMLGTINNTIDQFGNQTVAKQAQISSRYLSDIFYGKVNPSEMMLAKLMYASEQIRNISENGETLRKDIKSMMSETKISIGGLANHLDIDPSNLNKILSGSRKGLKYLEKAYKYLVVFN